MCVKESAVEMDSECVNGEAELSSAKKMETFVKGETEREDKFGIGKGMKQKMRQLRGKQTRECHEKKGLTGKGKGCTRKGDNSKGGKTRERRVRIAITLWQRKEMHF